MATYIGLDGRIRITTNYSVCVPSHWYGIENYFVNHATAQELREIIKKRYPLAFYGEYKEEYSN